MPLFPHELAIGHTNDLIMFNYGMFLLFHTKCTASFGAENPGVDFLAETQSEDNFVWM